MYYRLSRQLRHTALDQHGEARDGFLLIARPLKV